MADRKDHLCNVLVCIDYISLVNERRTAPSNRVMEQDSLQQSTFLTLLALFCRISSIIFHLIMSHNHKDVDVEKASNQ